MVETETTSEKQLQPNGRNRDHTERIVTNQIIETETTPKEQLQTQW
jgi:hypothetical protein